ncbi:MAG TPA: hypothetical protein DCZ41_00995, partial [Firmicutes bacterium]|nr:hypothetical protein [Bacillota bacterium]
EQPSSTKGEDTSNDTSLSSDLDVSPTSWSASDLTSMAAYLGEGVSLPFPVGFTSEYVEASGTDEDGVCFIAYDYSSGDLTSSYSDLLLADGFNKEESEDEDYYFFSKGGVDEENDLWVQIDYIDDCFEVFAWLEASIPTFETFPYAEINSFFGLSLSETTLPSFDLAQDELYQGYGSEDGVYFYVGGYFDTKTSDDDYLLDYATKLETAGYTVDLDNNFATNETLSFKVEFMSSEGYFFLQLSKYSKPQAGDHSLTLDKSSFKAQYLDDDSPLAVNEINFKFSSIMSSSDYVQFSKINPGKNRKGGEIYNVDSLGNIASIVVTAQSTNYYSTLSLYVSNASISSTNPGTSISPSASGNVFTYNVPTGNGYFKLVNESDQYASKNTSIVIRYTIA